MNLCFFTGMPLLCAFIINTFLIIMLALFLLWIQEIEMSDLTQCRNTEYL